MKKVSVILLIAFWQVGVGVLSVKVPNGMYIDVTNELVIQVEIVKTAEASEEFMVLSARIVSLSAEGMLAEVRVEDMVQLKIALSPNYTQRLTQEHNVYLRLDVFDCTGKCQPSMTKLRFCGTTASIDKFQNCLVLGIERFDHDLEEIRCHTPTEAPGFNIAMFLQLFQFANYLKSKNLVYRDFKPKNMGYNEDTPYVVHFFNFESISEVGKATLREGCKPVQEGGLPQIIMNPRHDKDGSFYWAVNADLAFPSFKDGAENACYVTIATVAGCPPWKTDQSTWAAKQDDKAIGTLISKHFTGVYGPLAQPLIDLVLEARQRDNGKIDIDYAPIINALKSILFDVMPEKPRTELLSLLSPPQRPRSSSVSTDSLRSSGGDKLRSSASGVGIQLRNSGSGSGSGSGTTGKFLTRVSSVLNSAKLRKSKD